MQELEYDYRVFQDNPSFGPQPGDEKLLVKFYMGYIEDSDASAQAGRPIYKDVECIKIITPGDRNNIVDRPLREADKARFSKQYAHYKQFGTEAVVGTVLDEWPLVTKAMCETLKAAGFHTVEQVADARDDIILRTPGMRPVVDKAKRYLEMAKGSAPLTELQKQHDELKANFEALAAQNAELNKRLSQMLDEQQAGKVAKAAK